MFLTAGNALVNPHVGLLFIDFELRKRLRLNGVASIGRRPAAGRVPGGAAPVRVEATEVFPNCPRYIHDTGSSSARASSRNRVRDARPRLEDAGLGR